MELKKRFIEKGLPIKTISNASKREKMGSAKSNLVEMHFWWTRKPLISSRTAILGSLLDSSVDSKTFTQMLGIGKCKKPFEYSYNRIDAEIIRSCCKTLLGKENPDEVCILDPFAGAGSIALESLRAGYSIHANDYNPVSWLLLKATLLYPKQYGSLLYEEVKQSFYELYDYLKKELISFYPSNYQNQQILGYIYSWIVKCSNCHKEVPLVTNWEMGGPRNDKEKYFLNYKIIQDNNLLQKSLNLETQSPQPWKNA